MHAWLIPISILNVIVAVQIVSSQLAPTSYKIIQHHVPVKSQYTTYFPKKPAFLSYTQSATHSYLDTGTPSIFSNLIAGPAYPKQLTQLSNGIRCAIAPQRCVRSPYRTLDGTCNNLQNPIWGAANTRYSRLLSPRYGDGYASPTVSITGQELPNPRLVSLVAFGEADVPDPQFTLVNMQWGQIITHDMSMLAGSTQSKKHGTRCCTDEGQLITTNAHKTCFPIVVPKNDPAHSQTNVQCMNFVRTLTDKDQNCPDTLPQHPAEQLTVVTAFMDLSIVYGNNDEQNQPIRAFQGGRMAVVERRGYEWPPQVQNATASCDTRDPQEVCYRTGDVRTNQNPGLTILQIILMREHNRIADVLQQINPHWDDELTYQEARRINIAQFQQISYYEWLPIFLGVSNMIKNRLIYQIEPGSYVNDYDPTIDPSVLNSHATAAFRYFHSQIEGRLDLISEHRSSTGSLRLSDWFNRPAIIEAGDNYDFLIRGLSTQPEQLTDINFDPEIKHFFFRRNRPFGGDLRTLDIQRNRDHGLASYNDFREFCGLRRAERWEDFLDLLSPKSIENLQTLYTSFEDVDLTVGASLEAHVDGTLAGPTFLCILTEQFYRTRVGDRYFFERGDKETAFSRSQLIELKKASVARLLCDNSNHVNSIQPQAFRRVSKSNEIVPCTAIPQVDLSAWKDHSLLTNSYSGAQTFYSTNAYLKK